MNERDTRRNDEMMAQKPQMTMQVESASQAAVQSDPVYGSNGRGYWLGHSNEHISKEEKFNRYLDTLKPRDQQINDEMKDSEASLKQAEEITGK